MTATETEMFQSAAAKHRASFEALANDLLTVADFLDDHPLLAEHGHFTGDRFGAHVYEADLFAAMVRELVDGAPLGAVTKDYDSSAYAVVRRSFGTLDVVVQAKRETVCERVVVGEETVQVPDPEAPLVTVTRPVTEWRCAPLLAAGAAE